MTILTRKRAKVPSSRLAQTVSIMGLRSPSTSTGVLHLNEFIENSGEILAHRKQKGWGRQWGEDQPYKLTSAISKAVW